MTVAMRIDHRATAVLSAVAVGMLVAGAADGYAIGGGPLGAPSYWLAGIVAAVPIGLLFAWWTTRWATGAVLATLGVLVFSLTLALEAGRAGAPPPLVIGAGAIVAAGLVAVALGRARPAAVLEALVLAWCAAAFIFEGTIIVLHAL